MIAKKSKLKITRGIGKVWINDYRKHLADNAKSGNAKLKRVINYISAMEKEGISSYMFISSTKFKRYNIIV